MKILSAAVHGHSDLSLRDYLALHAGISMQDAREIARRIHGREPSPNRVIEALAALRYQVAGQMLLERANAPSR